MYLFCDKLPSVHFLWASKVSCKKSILMLVCKLTSDYNHGSSFPRLSFEGLFHSITKSARRKYSDTQTGPSSLNQSGLQAGVLSVPS